MASSPTPPRDGGPAAGASDRAARPGRLERIGTAAARHPVAVIAAWILLLVVAFVADRAAGGAYTDRVSLPGTQAQAGANLLEANAPAIAGYDGLVVIHATTGTLVAQRAAIEQALANLRALPAVRSATDPFTSTPPTISADGRTAYTVVQFIGQPYTLGPAYASTLDRAVAPMRAAGLEVEYGRGLEPITRPQLSDTTGEAVGFTVALAVLLIGFGSVIGAALPLATALLSVGIGLSLLGLAAAAWTFGTASPTLAVMIGLGVGIDYALFLTTRFRQRVADGADPVAAAGHTVGTTGQAVLVAAGTVSVALLGLYASGMQFIGQLGLAAVFGVATAAAGAITLVPAGLALAGRRIDRIAVRRPAAEGGSDRDGWYRYARLVSRRAWWFLAGGVLLLAVLSAPLLTIRLGHVGDGADPASYTDKRAYDLIASAFGPGVNGTFTVVVDVRHATGDAAALARTLPATLRATPDVAAVTPFAPTPNGALLIGTVVPATGPQDAATSTLFHRLVERTLPAAVGPDGAHAYVTGEAASYLDFSSSVTAKLPLIIGVVVAMAFLVIMSAFRSLFLAVKAAILNLLSIGAAYGVVVAVFQWGWGRQLLGVSENVPIESYVPMMMFAIVFGLSMDYEVFLLSRVQEGWRATRDNTDAVARGLASTGRVITCAALIMASVFAAFVASTNVVIKMMAIGLATSVLIDASIVRLLLVPATMNLLGAWNWWLPRWLDRVLPHIEAEGPRGRDAAAAPK